MSLLKPEPNCTLLSTNPAVPPEFCPNISFYYKASLYMNVLGNLQELSCTSMEDSPQSPSRLSSSERNF